MRFFEILRDWSEVWALLIPLSIIIFFKPGNKKTAPLILYVIAGFLLNLIAIFILEFHHLVSSWVSNNNNILYNIHSFFRVVLISWYIITVRQYRFPMILKSVVALYILFVFINFIFLEPAIFLSTRLFAAESIVLLILCLNYFFRSIHDESQTNWLKHSSFLVCAGVSIYEAITFFIFLFFYPLSQKDVQFFVVTMRIYSITFIVFCILLALALHQSSKEKQE